MAIQVQYLHNRAWFGRHAPSLELPQMTVSLDPRTLLGADCAVLHLPSLLSANPASAISALRQTVPKRQVWIAETMESAANYPPQADPAFMALFDAEVSFRQAADVWASYIPHGLAAQPIMRPARFWRAKCCSFISSAFNMSGRQEYVRALMAAMPVHSYGRFERNRRIWFDRGRESKLARLRRHDFTLAFENSIETDYVTEKFFDPLLVGSVPVYLGAPNISEYAPGENCYIDVKDFPDPARLAAFLMTADVAAFHAWRQRPLRAQFLAKLAIARQSGEARLAALIARLVEARRKDPEAPPRGAD